MATVAVRGIEEVNGLMTAIAVAVKDENVLTEAAAILLNRTRTRFLSQEAPDGSTWPVSAAATQRAAEGRGGGTLFDTGNLFHSLAVRKPGTLKRALYTGVSYAAQHQLGTDGQIQRSFLGFSKDDINIIERLLVARLDTVT